VEVTLTSQRNSIYLKSNNIIGGGVKVLLTSETKGNEHHDVSAFHELSHKQLKKLARGNPDQIILSSHEWKELNRKLRHQIKKAMKHKKTEARRKAILKTAKKATTISTIVLAAAGGLASTDWGQELLHRGQTLLQSMANETKLVGEITGAAAAIVGAARVLIPVVWAVWSSYSDSRTQKKIKKLSHERNECRVHDPKKHKDELKAFRQPVAEPEQHSENIYSGYD
jgi:hypothetical protein